MSDATAEVVVKDSAQTAAPVEAVFGGKLEALLFSADRPLQAERLAGALKLVRLPEEAGAGEGNSEAPKAPGKPSTPAAIAAKGLVPDEPHKRTVEVEAFCS